MNNPLRPLTVPAVADEPSPQSIVDEKSDGVSVVCESLKLPTEPEKGDPSTVDTVWSVPVMLLLVQVLGEFCVQSRLALMSWPEKSTRLAIVASDTSDASREPVQLLFACPLAVRMAVCLVPAGAASLLHEFDVVVHGLLPMIGMP